MLRLRSAIGGVLILICISTFVAGVLYRQTLFDHVRVWQYQPTDEISILATRTAMSEKGTFYFYLAHPRLEQASEFNEECRRAEPAGALLGCYKPLTDTIHLYDVDSSDLEGVKEVTAAHEMLHVAYARLSDGEKEQLSPLLEAAYAKVKDEKFEERMAYYERAQPGSRNNELHSILATEFSDIGEELEQYYARYFTDRTKVVSWYMAYHQKFEDNERRADEMTQQLETQREQIDVAARQYEQSMIVYNQDVETFNQRASTGDFSSQTDFSQQRAVLQSRAEQLHQQRDAIAAQIDSYNESVEQLTAVGREQQRLTNSLDSMKAIE